MRIYKPWLYPESVFSMYLKLTGHQRVFETVKQFPLQVCLLDLRISMNTHNHFGRSSLRIVILVEYHKIYYLITRIVIHY